MDKPDIKEQLKKVIQAQQKVKTTAKTVSAILAAEKASESIER